MDRDSGSKVMNPLLQTISSVEPNSPAWQRDPGNGLKTTLSAKWVPNGVNKTIQQVIVPKQCHLNACVWFFAQLVDLPYYCFSVKGHTKYKLA